MDVIWGIYMHKISLLADALALSEYNFSFSLFEWVLI